MITSVDESRALRDVFIDIPPEFKEHPYSDCGSDDGCDFQSENLAEQLAERIQQNAHDWYDFEIYEDPPEESSQSVDTAPASHGVH